VELEIQSYKVLPTFSPDGSGILFLPSLGRKRYSGQREIAPENKKSTSFEVLSDIKLTLNKI